VQKKTGLAFLFPYQKLVVANTLEGKDQVVILPTGAGKSLCFQLPALLLPGTTLVIFPLLSLMTDQLRRLREQGVPCAALRGGQSAGERSRLWHELAEGRLKLLLATPEGILVPRTIERLRGACISHLVIDEAHCVSEWGDSFRPSYLELGRVRAEAGIPLMTAFTATASPDVLQRVASVLFGSGDYTLVRANPDRPNISYSVVPTICKDHTVAALVREAERPAVVFCRTRPGAERTARFLRERLGESEIYFYHAGLSKPEKERIEKWFFESSSGVLAATCAYGMGVDKANIRTVIHRDVPPSVEAFLQESGRGGRDRKPAYSALIVSSEDHLLARRIADPTARERYLALLRLASQSGRCRRAGLLELLDAEPELCFGCDVCEGRVVEHPEGEEALVGLVRRARRRYTAREIAYICVGRRSHEAVRRGLLSARGWGILSAWEHDEIVDAVEALVAAGTLAIPRRGPWKGRLTLPGRKQTKAKAAALSSP